ncbi:MAG: biotin--[acetyl-CoA-carboxylase] ligase [Candidatus Cloacimonadota bacterium]|nr:MAG: biotin--[acetyl-CoA-carboxylase] ligase [Candidatus Cloacimonadota bacterium]
MLKERCKECKLNFVFFKKLLYFNRLKSTNIKLYNLMEKGSDSPDVVIAGKQTEGRGRRDNYWFSPLGGLWMSGILPDVLSNKDITTLNISCGLACAKACDAIIRDTGVSNCHILLRWPNDIILENKKLGGVLIEVKTEGQSKKSIILGIGINVNQKGFPKNLEKSAVSLFMLLKKRVSRKSLMFYILTELDKMIIYIKEKGTDGLLQEWKNYSYEVGKKIEISVGNNIKKSGKVLGIGKSGELIIVDSNSTIIKIFNGYNLKLLDK